MNTATSDQILRFGFWFLTLVHLILALYLLSLNIWHTRNRQFGAFLLILAVNSYSMGLLAGSDNPEQARLPTILIAGSTPIIELGRLVVAVLLLKADWMRDHWDRRWVLLYVLILLPMVLTGADLLLGTRLWYVGLDAGSYSGGYAPLSTFSGGSLRPFITTIYLFVSPTVTLLFLLYLVVRQRQSGATRIGLTSLLLIAQATAMLLRWGLGGSSIDGLGELISGAVFACAYSFAVFWQIAVETGSQRGRLLPRLVALVLAITIPLLVAVGALVSEQAGEILTQNAMERLGATNRALASNVSVWLDLNASALQELASLPDIVSMDPALQDPLLQAMAKNYPHMYLVSTADNVTGLNVARSDDLALQNYRGRLWHQGARNGRPLTYDVYVDQITGQPVLVLSTPIRRDLGTIVGVAMFASTLTDISREVQASTVGDTGFAYVVDAQNRVVAYPDPAASSVLQDFDTAPPVFALRAGNRGAMTFTDDEGERWRAFVDSLDNDWGIVVQIKEAELLNQVSSLRRASAGVIGVGALLAAVLAGVAIRQSLRPIEVLTSTAVAIADGDLSRRAPVESQDEFGLLAHAFNGMTEQLRELIDSLERRVAERTTDLAQRTAYLEASAKVARTSSAILEQDRLIREVAELIREQFNLYYVGLFLTDEAGKWAILRAGTGSAGRAMMGRGHRIKVGEGMIGWSILNARPRVAQEASDDTVRLTSIELPDTRSEAAIPLRSRGRVLGGLTVQDTRPNAFDPLTITALQTMADQVAVALDNAQLYAEAQDALASVRRAYGQITRGAWSELLSAQGKLVYRSDQFGVVHLESESPGKARHSTLDELVAADGQTVFPLSVPITVRGEPIGRVETYKLPQDGEWTPDEVAILRQIVEHLGLALEDARLYEDSQRRALREQLAREITEKIRAAPDIEAIALTAARELTRALGTERGVVKLTTRKGDDNGNAPQNEC
jgi:GAF domain-containing protein